LESIQCEAKFFSCALGGSTRTATFNLAENDEASSLLDLPDESKIGAVTKGKEEVKVIDLCTAMSMANVNNIDLLKLDIEGTEVEVLNSITQETADRISQISVEFHSAPEFDLSIDHDVPKTIEYLKDIGYIFLDFSRKSRRNCLFLNRNHVDIGWLKEIYYSVRHNHLPFVKSKVTNFCK
jgi:FkbM family methyltransferase